MHDKAAQKEAQRKKGIEARKALGKEKAAQYGQTVAHKLLNASVYAEAKTIFSYQPFNGETDIALFNHQALLDGKQLAFPICEGVQSGKMVAAVPMDADAWETGKYGIRAPIKSRSIILDPIDIDLVIVPCTAFNGAQKMRIGMGAGYYDRYLPQCEKAVAIAVAYEAQQVDAIYTEPWDVALHAIVTELNWYA